jgi:small-conductance mechanosensitive channel
MRFQKRLRKYSRYLAVACCAVVAIAGRPLQGQEPAQPPPAAVDSQPAGPTFIVSAEISRQAQVDLTLLASLQSREDQALVIQRFGDEIVATSLLVDTLQIETGQHIGDRQSMGRLETLRTQWLRVDGKWNAISSRLHGHAERLQSDLDSVRAIRTRWQVTRDSIGESELPEALRNRISQVLQDVDDAEGTTRDLLNASLTLEDQVAQLSAEATAHLVAIDEALSVARVRIVARDSRPLWSLLLHPPEDTPIFEQGENLFDELWLGAVEAIENDSDPLLIHLLFTFVLLGWFVLQSRRSRLWSTDDEGMLVARLVMGRPGAAVLLLSMLAVRVTIPDVPVRFVSLLTLAAVAPLYRLLPRMIPRLLRPALYGFAGVFLFAVFVELLEPYSVVWRLSLLVSNLLGLWTLRLALQVQPESSTDPSVWSQTFRKLGYAVGVFLGIAFVGNLFGFTALAHFLLRGSYLAVYYVLLLIAVALILEAMWVALLRVPLVLKSNAVRRNTRTLQRRGIRAVRVVAVVAWLAQLLSIFGIFVPVTGWLLGVLNSQLHFGEIGLSLGGILAFFVTLWAAFAVSRFIRFLLEEDVMPRVDLPRGVPRAINIMLHYTLVVVAFLLAISAAGVDLGKLTILAGAFGLGIGFGLQNIINNFVSGLILLFERPIQIGDTVEVGTLIGQVKRIGIRSSTIRSYTGAEVIVPNANLVSAEVINWTLSDRRRRLMVSVGVKYGTDPEAVLDILKTVAAEHEKVLSEPAPWPLFKEFGDSSLNFEVRFWVLQYEDGMQVASDVTVAVNRALADAGIEIPFPQRDLHLKSGVPPSIAVVPEPTTEGAGDSA